MEQTYLADMRGVGSQRKALVTHETSRTRFPSFFSETSKKSTQTPASSRTTAAMSINGNECLYEDLYQESISEESTTIDERDASPKAKQSNDSSCRGKLTVFQAAPLIGCNNEGELFPIPMLDFDRERELLEESLGDADEVGADIDLVFETATTDRLGAFLATSGTQALHISCHGDPENLCFEGETGMAHPLSSKDLRGFISAGTGELRFVFVSACYSEAVGNAFVNAGVPHVVCCRQDEPLMDAATAEFSCNFYRALACGRKLRESFELGRQAVKLSPSVTRYSSFSFENEMKKYLLLPEGGDHNVSVFSNRSPQRVGRACFKRLAPPSWILPQPPNKFMGRELDMYRILRALRANRLIRVVGTRGIGKRSLVAAVCQYLDRRRRMFSIDEIIWLPLVHTPQENQLYSCFRQLFDILQNENPAIRLNLDSNYKHFCGTIIERLHSIRANVIIDTRDFVTDQGTEKLSMFLRELLRATKNVKLILLCDHGSEVEVQGGYMAGQVNVGPLNFESTATLFGMLCPIVVERNAWTPLQFTKFLCQGQERSTIHTKGLSKRGSDVLSRIGKGIPSDVYEAAMAMSSRQFDELVEIGKRKECSRRYETRAELDYHIANVGSRACEAARRNDFCGAKELQNELHELTRMRDFLPNVVALRMKMESLGIDLLRATTIKDYAKASDLHENMTQIQKDIALEEKFLKRNQNDSKPFLHDFLTRVELEVAIQKVEKDIDIAAEVDANFCQAQVLQESVDELVKRRLYYPSKINLMMRQQYLESAEHAAIRRKSFVSAQLLHQEREAVSAKVAAEEASEEKIFHQERQEKETEAPDQVSDPHQPSFDAYMSSIRISSCDEENHLLGCAPRSAGEDKQAKADENELADTSVRDEPESSPVSTEADLRNDGENALRLDPSNYNNSVSSASLTKTSSNWTPLGLPLEPPSQPLLIQPGAIAVPGVRALALNAYEEVDVATSEGTESAAQSLVPFVGNLQTRDESHEVERAMPVASVIQGGNQNGNIDTHQSPACTFNGSGETHNQANEDKSKQDVYSQKQMFQVVGFIMLTIVVVARSAKSCCK